MTKAGRDAHAWLRGYSDALEGKPENFASTLFGEEQAGAYGRGWANGAHKMRLAREPYEVEDVITEREKHAVA